MADFPINYGARVAERVRIQREANLEAARKAARTGRSLKCSGSEDIHMPPRHAGTGGGCRNNGSTCICECHDPAPEAGRG